MSKLQPETRYTRAEKFCSCGKKLSRGNKTGYCKECVKGKGFNISNNNTRVNHIVLMQEGKLERLNWWAKAKIKIYFLEKQNNKCIICGIDNVWNGKELIFILDHIDGDSTNHTEENFRLICHNCDSQLPTYKSKNKGNGRKYDREYRRKHNPIVGDGTALEMRRA